MIPDRVLLATFVESLTIVYMLMIVLYILQSWVRLGYSTPVMATRRFLDDTVGPYLMLFRRYIPPIGPIDLSAMVGLFLLWIVSGLIQRLILG